MKKTLLLLMALTLGLGLKAQCPLTTAVDFTATDCHGTQVHLFDILDGGQYVLIDFFYTTCGPCQQATPKVVESYYTMGCNMHDVFYMEISPSDANSACQTWANNYGVEYPTIGTSSGGNTICNQYQIGAYPTLILIAPDRTILIQDLWPINNAQSVVSALEGYGLQQHDCSVEDIAPDFIGTDTEGNDIHLYDILDAGQAVLINFFLYGDEISENVMGDVVAAFHNYGCNEHDVFFIEISPNGNDEQCLEWAEQFKVQYPTISRDGGGNDIAQSIPVGFYPTLMLIRPDHTIAIRDIYPPTYEYIAQALDNEYYEQFECLSEINESGNTAITLFPNPANESVTLIGESLGTIRIYNALGQLIEVLEANGSELHINTSGYENGVYFVKVNESSLRFVVTH